MVLQTSPEQYFGQQLANDIGQQPTPSNYNTILYTDNRIYLTIGILGFFALIALLALLSTRR